MEVAAPVMDAGAKDGVMPSGTLDVVRATGAVKPFSGVVEMVYMAQGVVTEVVAIAPAGSSRPPDEPLNTGVGVPAPTQTVSAQLLCRTN